MTPVAYRMHLRIAHAQRLLISSEKSSTDIALEAGFGSVSRFYAAFREVVGGTPLGYRKQLR